MRQEFNLNFNERYCLSIGDLTADKIDNQLNIEADDDGRDE